MLLEVRPPSWDRRKPAGRVPWRAQRFCRPISVLGKKNSLCEKAIRRERGEIAMINIFMFFLPFRRANPCPSPRLTTYTFDDPLEKGPARVLDIEILNSSGSVIA